MKRLLFLFACCCSLLLTAQTRQSEHNQQVAAQLEIFNTLYRELDLHYVDTIEAARHVGDAAQYLLRGLDPYTEYYPEESTHQLRQLTTGKYGGIGTLISFRPSERRCIIAGPYGNTPAAEAGLLPGDIILAFDGVDCGLAPTDGEAAYTEHISQSLRGEPGTAFNLSVRRYGRADTITVCLTRRPIQLPSVTYAGMLPGDSVGYVMLESYTEQTTRELQRAVGTLISEGAKRLVLDLRDNGGGLLDQAVAVVGLFVPKNSEVVSLRGRQAAAEKTYRTQEEPLAPTLPLAILVSPLTASSAEITAGALQDYDRAIIVGGRTYGKGLVQESRPLPFGGMLKLTSARYHLPSGRCIQAYSYADGVPQHLPDSLAHLFKTKAGRSVYDGGGISPDVAAAPDSLPMLIDRLASSEQLLDYLAHYHASHPALPTSVRDFRLSADEYAEMTAFLQQHGFTYDNRSQSALQLLRQIASFEGYGAATKAAFDSLQQQLQPQFERDFQYWEPVIRAVVESRIVGLYGYQAAEAEYALRDDPELRAALEVLCSDEAYEKCLKASHAAR